MTVWFSVVASVAFMYMTVYADEFGKIGTLIFALVYIATFFGGAIYDSRRKDRIEKLEKEVEKLKENNKEN